jgi:hypothetical protein
VDYHVSRAARTKQLTLRQAAGVVAEYTKAATALGQTTGFPFMERWIAHLKEYADGIRALVGEVPREEGWDPIDNRLSQTFARFCGAGQHEGFLTCCMIEVMFVMELTVSVLNRVRVRPVA